MKNYHDWHKYGSVALLIGCVVSVCSEISKHKFLHFIGVLLVGAGTGVCIYSGHKIIDKAEDDV